MAAGKTKMKINSKDFRVGEGGKVNLEKWPTKIEPVYKSKERYKSLLEEHVAKLSVMQELDYASNRHAVFVILQAIDAAEKDGAIRHVMSGVNPQGCLVGAATDRRGNLRFIGKAAHLPPRERGAWLFQLACAAPAASSQPPEKPARRSPVTI
jgi:polyphosphate kinase 2 (PPK2 family)